MFHHMDAKVTKMEVTDLWIKTAKVDTYGKQL